jgi:hypothetical protein
VYRGEQELSCFHYVRPPNGCWSICLSFKVGKPILKTLRGLLAG